MDRLGGAGLLAELLELVGRLGTEAIGVRDPEDEALALADQGVVCWACRNAGAFAAVDG